MKNSFLTVTDQFCGAGGSTLGAISAGVEVRLGLNHWKVAVETYNTNHPNTDVECADISMCDPRRYRSTDILITSPECTTHSPAGGNRRRSKRQLDAFIDPGPDDPSLVRSRATAWDVVRFTEVHRYRVIIVENVLEFATQWELFPAWLRAMHDLGYRHRVVSLNSMFCHPTPQSRDRVYVVFWRKGNRAPNLDVGPIAWCLRCERQVEAAQMWKPGRAVGKYRQQYVYGCPACGTAVTPYYFAALNALDLSLPAERIGDRKKPLATRTLGRVAYGLGKYGRRLLLVRVTNGYGNNHGVSDGCAACPTQTARHDVAMLSPGFLVNGHMGRRVYGVDQPASAQSASRPHDALVQLPGFLIPPFGERGGQAPRVRALDEAAPAVTSRGPGELLMPFLVETAFTHAPESRVTGIEAGMPTQTAKPSRGLVMPFVVTQRTNATGTGPHDPLTTICSGNHHLLVQGSALIRAPFLLTYDRHNLPTGLDDPLATVTTIDRTMLVGPDSELPAVEDCYFRMLEPFEIGRAMAFPDTYRVLGTKRDRVKMYGNAVTPPVMDLLVRRAIESLHPELAR